MGCWGKYIVPIYKEVRGELTKRMFREAGVVVKVLDAALADEKITKDEAKLIATTGFVGAFDISMGAAEMLLTAAVRVFSDRHGNNSIDAVDEEEDDAPIELPT